ncbi:WXG100 family type VII secretion target [Saccharothrix sp. ALI-22-I]|uniref:WXG100 family type VII secretion target n=1 Tax=Saccharothrix sp. ALI-22-I TaxID=1933778 RepID=UPI0015C3031E|nr:hypothetical protein [Saccharothrix sp. ALI-22-I]
MTFGESTDAACGPGDVWAEHFAAPVPMGGVNWDAYTHEELHDMLWREADVADVGTVAEEWRRHSAELAGQATELRDQQAALRAGWEGDAAELAGAGLGELADRLDTISAHSPVTDFVFLQRGEENFGKDAALQSRHAQHATGGGPMNTFDVEPDPPCRSTRSSACRCGRWTACGTRRAPHSTSRHCAAWAWRCTPATAAT